MLRSMAANRVRPGSGPVGALLPGLTPPRHGRSSSQETTDSIIGKVLESARTHLEMDVAFVGEFRDGQEVFRAIAGDGRSFGLNDETAVPLPSTYCQALVDGRIGNVVPDAAADPVAAGLEVTTTARIGSYVGVPLHLPDGRLYGTLCGVGHGADPSLGPRDARLMKFLATIVEVELGREDEDSSRRQALLAEVRPLLSGHGLKVVFQPIVELASGATVGFEALSRFSLAPARPPDAWFATATEVGLGLELEMTAVEMALRSLGQLPTNCYLSLNVSAETACSDALGAALAGVDRARVVLEITEHAAVANYQGLNTALAPLRSQGVRLAVDDAGAGVASLHHILELAPEVIKLDISLTRGINDSPPRAALATALLSFGAATGAAILAEGIETPAEFNTLLRLGVAYGQGYLLGRPGSLPAPAKRRAAAPDTARRQPHPAGPPPRFTVP